VTDERTDVLAEVVGGEGSTVVRVDDPSTAALELVDALDADLVDSLADLDPALEGRFAAIESRTRALTALSLHAQLQADDDSIRHVVTDLDELRRLVGRIQRADELIDSSRGVLRDRLSSGTGVAVHPDAIRKAALDVTEARAAVSQAETEIADLEAADSPAEEPEVAPAPPTPPSGGRRDAILRAVAVFCMALGVGAVGFGLGYPVALLIPVLAVVWAVLFVIRSDDDLADRHLASDNLAAVSALTDRAYGGVALSEPQELVDARRRLAAAGDRLRYAEGVWRGLVGTTVDPADVDEYLTSRDPGFQVGDAELARTPTVRAAEGHRRRLLAQWKLAWWALDRPVPAVGDARAALDALADEGVDRISVETYEARSPLRRQEQERFEELAEGRSVDELRSAADARPAPLVVLDEAGEISGSDLAARTAALPSDVRVLVVAPAGG
jgi:hypothetical protein